jgi:hypothetical protein
MPTNLNTFALVGIDSGPDMVNASAELSKTVCFGTATFSDRGRRKWMIDQSKLRTLRFVLFGSIAMGTLGTLVYGIKGSEQGNCWEGALVGALFGMLFGGVVAWLASGISRRTVRPMGFFALLGALMSGSTCGTIHGMINIRSLPGPRTPVEEIADLMFGIIFGVVVGCISGAGFGLIRVRNNVD